MYRMRVFKCLQCQKEITKRASPDAVFCSQSCSMAHRNDPTRNPAKAEAAKAKIAASRRGKPTTLGITIPEDRKRRISETLKGYVFTDAHRHNISERAKIAGIRPPRKAGPDHYNWKGGIAGERSKRYGSDEYKGFVKTCLSRDHYTCQHCGAKNGMGIKVVLQVHHLKSYAEHLEDRYDPDNGITLCISCHYKATKGLPRPSNPVWTGRDKTCVHCGEVFRVRNPRKFCPSCRLKICCPLCGSTVCTHAARRNLPYNTTSQ